MKAFWNKICRIFGVTQKPDVMPTDNLKISVQTVKKANEGLMSKSLTSSYDGTFRTKIVVNGVPKVREISKDEINKAFVKSLKTNLGASE